MRGVRTSVLVVAVAFALALIMAGTASAAVQMYIYFPGQKAKSIAGTSTEWTVKRMQAHSVKRGTGTVECVYPEPPWQDIVSEPEPFKVYSFEFGGGNAVSECTGPAGETTYQWGGTHVTVTATGKGVAKMAGVQFSVTNPSFGMCFYSTRGLKGKFAVGHSGSPVPFEPVMTGTMKLTEESGQFGCDSTLAFELAFEVKHEGETVVDELAPKVKK